MIGAIIGDIVGSRFEFSPHKDKEFALFAEECRVTDDTIMTLAVAKAIMETEKKTPLPIGGEIDMEYECLLEENTVYWLQKLGRKYPDCGFGGMFAKWVQSDEPEPYNSFGNGAAMRISPVAYAGRTEWEVSALSRIVTGVTHNHEEGLKGAEAVAAAIFMARRGYTRKEIRDKIASVYYSLDFTLDDIRESYEFNETCQNTVPQAIVAFLQSVSFEDAIRNAISIGGDSDTLAAIAGAIAEAYYGVPRELKEKALSYLDDELLSILQEWADFIGNTGEIGQFHVLTKYIGKFANTESFGEWIIDKKGEGTIDNPFQMPFVNFDELVDLFVTEFYQFSDAHPEYNLTKYYTILEENGLKWDYDSMARAEVNALDERGLLALIMGAIRAERFCGGALLSFLKDGYLLTWLQQLKVLEDSGKDTAIEEIYFSIGGFHGGYDRYRLVFRGDSAKLITVKGEKDKEEKALGPSAAKKLEERFSKLSVENWNCEYVDPFILDGTQWELGVKRQRDRGTMWSGSNAYPPNWKELLSFFKINVSE